MAKTDPVADLLTCIRNANMKRMERVDIPASRLGEAIVKIMVAEGYLKSYKRLEDRKQGILRVYLRYGARGRPALTKVQRISRPGLRRYGGYRDIPKVLGGGGVAIITTPRGIMTDRQAREERVGGEVIAHVW